MPQVIDVKSGSEKGQFSLAMVQNYIQQRQEFELTYYVVADNTSQDFTVIAATAGLPILGQRLYGMYCTEVEPGVQSQVKHFLTGVLTYLWEVQFKFSTLMRDPNDNTPNVNWGGEIDKEHLEFDMITGAKIITTADEPIFTDRPVVYQTLMIHRQEPYPFDPTTVARFVGRTNLTNFWNFPPGTCMMLPIEVEERTEETDRICWVTYNIKIKLAWNFDGTLMSNTWQARLLNQGFMYRPAKGAKPLVNRDKNGQPAKVNLDANGLILKDSEGMSFDIVDFQSFNSIIEGPITSLRSTDTPPIIATSGDIGSVFIIPFGGSGTNEGEYEIVDVQTVGGQECWLLDGNAGSIGAGTGIIWQLQRAPIYLYFNRAWPVDFNLLTLGPF